MRKNYTLLKDLPDVKAGAIFEIGITLDAYYLTSDKTGTKYNCYCYPKDFVENNSEWFKFNMQKPPLGIIPMWLHNEKRYDALMDAIKRYKEAGYDDEVFIKEWVAEAQSLFAYLKGRAEEQSKTFSVNEIKDKLETVISKIQFHNRMNDRKDEDYWCCYSSLLREHFYSSL